MKFRQWVTPGTLFLVSWSFSLSANAVALPFEPTPQSFLEYVKTVDDWEDGSKRRFIKVHSATCGGYPGEYPDYTCEFDYREITSLGERTCINMMIRYRTYLGGGIDVLDSGECNYWKDARQSAPKISTQNHSQSTQLADGQQSNLTLAALGSALFLLGCGCGLLLGKLTKQK